MVIEKAQLKDIPQLLEMYGDLYEHNRSVEEAEETYKKILEKSDYTLLTVKEDGKVYGTAMVILCSGLTDNFIVVEDVVVRGTERGKGIGKMLFERIDEMAAENNCFYSMLVSSGFRKGAHAFYKKMGYVDDALGFRKVYIEQ